MKCKKCGYVSFDNLESCKNCGLSFAFDEEEAVAGSETGRLQDELFSLKPEDGDSTREEAAAVSPSLEGEKSGTTPGAQESAPEGIDADREMEEEPALYLDEEPVPPAVVRAEELTLETSDVDGTAGERVPAAWEVAEEREEAVPDEVVLPKLEIDFDPAAVTGASEEEPLGEDALFQEEEIIAGGGDDEREEIIDDETALPEDLWIEEGAGFVPRLGAFAIDAGAISGVLGLFFLGALGALGNFGHGWSYLRTPAGIGALFVPFYLLGLCVSMCYYTFFGGWTGRTPGKVLMGLDIQRTDGGEMTYTRAFLRWVGYLVSITFAGLGFLWIVIDERKRGWHDYLSGTWVKNKREGTPGEG